MFKLAGILEMVALAGAGLIATGWLPLEILGALVAVPTFLAALAFGILGWIDVAARHTSTQGKRERKAEQAARQRAVYRQRTAERERLQREAAR